MIIETSTVNVIISITLTGVLAYNVWLIKKLYEISEKLSNITSLLKSHGVFTIQENSD